MNKNISHRLSTLVVSILVSILFVGVLYAATTIGSDIVTEGSIFADTDAVIGGDLEVVGNATTTGFYAEDMTINDQTLRFTGRGSDEVNGEGDVQFYFPDNDGNQQMIAYWDAEGNAFDWLRTLVINQNYELTVATTHYANGYISRDSGPLAISTADAQDQGVTIQNMLELNSNTDQATFSSPVVSPTTTVANLLVVPTGTTPSAGDVCANVGALRIDTDAAVGSRIIWCDGANWQAN